MISAKIIEDSISTAGKRITTVQLVYPRFIHAEVMTHRVFSRNASSSRAIPVKKMLEMIRNEPAMPIHWGLNQPGMQAEKEMEGVQLERAKHLWLIAANDAADTAEKMMHIGLHKQVANRILEPFQHIHVIVTSTEWGNFFELRCHPDAQPEIQALGVAIREAINASVPNLLQAGEWHLPFITIEERNDSFFKIPANKNLLQKISSARCCRVSYLKHDDMSLFARLAAAVPIHASPLEHQGTPADTKDTVSGNFIGWVQFRKLWEKELYESK